MKYSLISKPALTLLFSGILSFAGFAQSAPVKQKTAEELTAARNDSIIITDIINPTSNDALGKGQTPDWEAMRSQIALKYDGTYADRTITKARIYFYYGKDWPLFSTAIVHYTEAYEDKDDLRLMNKNAKYILRYSQEPAEWKKAQSWVKHAVDKEPSNSTYKETYDALEMKIKG